MKRFLLFFLLFSPIVFIQGAESPPSGGESSGDEELIRGIKRLAITTGSEGSFPKYGVGVRRQVPRVKKQELNNLALTDGLGYKTANLITLKKILSSKWLQQRLKRHAITVAVPEFVGISSGYVQKLFAQNGFNIVAKWNLFSRKYRSEQSGKRNIITTFSNACQFFSNMILKQDLIARDFFQEQEVSEFLQQSRDKNWRLMVRSTGKEDTEELSNAGGNFSAANVSSDNQAILDAIKQVVASYFSPKSISQRLDAGDTTIFDKPLTPVLLQRMVGEQLNGAQEVSKIPVGCVVYTHEPEGYTPGVTVIQSSWGHNEGVVESKVPIDTFYVKDQIFSTVKVKMHRIVPTHDEKSGAYGLGFFENPLEIQRQSSLSKAAIKVIQLVAQAIHKAYGKPMDIELVYMPHERKVYVVQARPLQIARSNPSYIKNIKNIDKSDIVSCSSVSVADGSVKEIRSKTQLLLADTLAQALDLYNGLPNREEVKVVIVSGSADVTSHAAAIFRGAGIAILTSDHVAKLREWVYQDNLNMLVDAQRELVVRSTGDEKSMDVDVVTAGWFVHPIAQKFSVFDEGLRLGEEPDVSLVGAQKIGTQLDILKDGNFEEANAALSTILRRLYLEAHLAAKAYRRFEMSEEGVNEEDEDKAEGFRIAAEQQQRLYRSATVIAQAVASVLHFEPRSIERLYPINVLEALIKQKKDFRIVDAYSLSSVVDGLRDELCFLGKTLKRAIPDHQKRAAITRDRELFSLMQAGAEVALTEGVEDRWIQFSGQFREGNEKRGALFEMLAGIQSFDIMPTWINAMFAPMYKDDPENCFALLYAEYENSKDFLQQMQPIRSCLDAYDIFQWSDPANFEKKLLGFQESFGGLWSREFMSAYEDGTKLSKFVALGIMRQLVETWDQSIKELKGSTQYEVVEKVGNFKKMLLVYLGFLRGWSFVGDYWLEPLVRLIQKATDTEVQLESSLGFNVIKAIERGEDSRFAPEMLEDVFTLIHQKLISKLSNEQSILLENIELPERLSELEKAILAYKTPLLDTGYSGVSTMNRFEGKQFVQFFNIVLRTHGLQVKMIYDKQDKQILLTMTAYGQNEYGRWTRDADFIKLTTSLLNEIDLVQHEFVGMNYSCELLIKEKLEPKILTMLITYVNYISGDTDHLYKILDSEQNMLSNIKNIVALEKNEVFLYQLALKVLYDSLQGDRIHWLFPQALRFLKYDDSDKSKLEQILERLKTDENYRKSTQLFLCKQLNDSRGWKDYYRLTPDNADKLLEKIGGSLNDYDWIPGLIKTVLMLADDKDFDWKSQVQKHSYENNFFKFNLLGLGFFRKAFEVGVLPEHAYETIWNIAIGLGNIGDSFSHEITINLLGQLVGVGHKQAITFFEWLSEKEKADSYKFRNAVRLFRGLASQEGGYAGLTKEEKLMFLDYVLTSDRWKDDKGLNYWLFEGGYKALRPKDQAEILVEFLKIDELETDAIEMLKDFIEQGGGYEKLESHKTGGFYKSLLTSGVWRDEPAIKYWLLGDGYNSLKSSDQAEMLWAFLSIEELKIEGVQFLKDFIKQGGGYEKLDLYETGGFYKKILESEVWRDEQEVRVWMFVDTQKRRLLEGVLMSKMTKAKSVELLKYFIKQGGGYEKLESYETGGFYKSVLKSKVWLYGSAIKVWLLGDGYNFLKPSDQAEMLWAFLSIEELKIEGVQFLKDFIKHGGGYEKLESYKTGGFYKKILESEVWRDESTIKAWLLVDGFIWVSKFSKDDVIKEAAKYGLKIPQ